MISTVTELSLTVKSMNVLKCVKTIGEWNTAQKDIIWSSVTQLSIVPFVNKLILVICWKMLLKESLLNLISIKTIKSISEIWMKLTSLIWLLIVT